MPPKYSAAVLSIVALSAWSASSMATTGSLRKDIMPSSYASDEMNATHVPVSSTQRSKSNTNLTTRDTIDEERARMPLETTRERMMQNLRRLFGDKFCDSLHFTNWFESLSRYQYKALSEKSREDLLEVSAKHYEGDLTNSLIAGTKMDGAVKKLAEALLNKMVTVWLNDDTFDPKGVFKILELDHANGNIFEHPHFFIWVSYVKSKYPDIKEAYEIMFANLKPFYQGDDLGTVLAARAKIENRKDIAIGLLSIQLEEWKAQGKSAKDVFMLLRLEQTEGNLFENNIFSKWKHYINLIAWTKKKILKAAFTALEEVHGDRLPSILLVGTKIESTQKFANSLLDLQFQSWKRNAKDASTVFELLGLKQTEGNLFDNPLFPKWKKYFESTTSFSSLEDFLGKIYITLKTVYCDRLAGDLEGTTTESTRLFAKELLYMDKNWETDAQGAINRFMELGLKRTQGNLFGSPSYSKWLEEVKTIFPTDTPMHTSAILQHLFSHEELVGVWRRGVSDENTKSAVLELIPNQSFKEAMINDIFGV